MSKSGTVSGGGFSKGETIAGAPVYDYNTPSGANGKGGSSTPYTPDTISGHYSSYDKRGVLRPTVTEGYIIVRDKPDTDLSGLNRDIDRAREITKDEKAYTDIYISPGALDEIFSGFQGITQGYQELAEKINELLPAVKKEIIVEVVSISQESAIAQGKSQQEANAYTKDVLEGLAISAKIDETVKKHGGSYENVPKEELERDVQAGKQQLKEISLQDHQENKSSSWHTGADVTVGYGAMVSGNLGMGKGKGVSDWVGQQTSIVGKEKTDIYVEKNTHIKGAIIATEPGGELTLNTGTLTFEEIKDKSKGQDWSASVSQSGTVSGGGLSQGETIAGAPVYDYNTSPEANAKGDSNIPYIPEPISGHYASYDKRGVLRPTVTEGDIIVRDKPDTDLSGLNRDIDRAREVTKDEKTFTDIYISPGAIQTIAEGVKAAISLTDIEQKLVAEQGQEVDLVDYFADPDRAQEYIKKEAEQFFVQEAGLSIEEAQGLAEADPINNKLNIKVAACMEEYGKAIPKEVSDTLGRDYALDRILTSMHDKEKLTATLNDFHINPANIIIDKTSPTGANSFTVNKEALSKSISLLDFTVILAQSDGKSHVTSSHPVTTVAMYGAILAYLPIGIGEGAKYLATDAVPDMTRLLSTAGNTAFNLATGKDSFQRVGKDTWDAITAPLIDFAVKAQQLQDNHWELGLFVGEAIGKEAGSFVGGAGAVKVASAGGKLLVKGTIKSKTAYAAGGKSAKAAGGKAPSSTTAEAAAKKPPLKVANMEEFFTKTEFGKLLKANSRPTSEHFKSAKIYTVTKKFGKFKEGDKFYLDTLHKDHLEVFRKGKAENVFNLDGSVNTDKLGTVKGRKLK